jgi:hypothetical protein
MLTPIVLVLGLRISEINSYPDIPNPYNNPD